MDIAIGSKLPISPDFWDEQKARSFWRRSYKAGAHYAYGQDALGGPILFPMTGETDKQAANFTRRQSRAAPIGKVGSIIDRYVGFCTRQPASRPTGPQWFIDFLNSVDGDETSMTEFQTELLRKGLIEKEAYVLINTTNEDGDTVSSLQAEGVQARLSIVCADKIPYIVEQYGVIKEVFMITDQKDEESFTGYLMTPATIQELVITRKASEKYNSNNTYDYVVTSVGPVIENAYEAVPLVKFCPGTDMIEHLSEMQRQLLNHTSLRDTGMTDTVFNQQVFTGVDDDTESRIDIRRGSDMIICLPKDADVKYVAPPADTIKQIQDVINDTKAEIDSFAGVGTTESNGVESGLAKAFKFDELNVRIATIVKALQKSENKIVKLVSIGLGYDYPGDCKWPNDFQTPVKTEDLDTTTKVLSSALPTILKQTEVKNFASEHYELDAASTKLLDEQIKAIGETPAPIEDDGEDDSEESSEDK